MLVKTFRHSFSLRTLITKIFLFFVLFNTDKILAQNLVNSESTVQVPPRVIPPRPTEPPLPPPQPLPEVPHITPSTPRLTPELPQIPGNITVIEFTFTGNTAFSTEELVAVTAPFTNRPLTFAELLQAEAVVTKLYTNAGYINSGAIIPANQTLNQNAAIVNIQIIEGGIEDIQVTVDGRLKSEYIRSRLALATTKPLNQNRLLEALQLLQLNPLIESLSAELSTGSRPELSLLTVRVKEADTFDLELVADNGRNPSVGSFQRGLRIIQDNVLGYGDGFFLEYMNTDGSNNLDLRYSIPVNPRNGTVILAGGINYSRVIEEPFNELDITGNSAYFNLTLRQPVIQTPKHEFALGITASHQESNNEILGINYPLSPSADENGQTRISVLRFFQEWLQRNPQDVLAVRSQFNVGLGIGSTVNAYSPDSLFFSWRGQGQYVRLLAPDTLFVVRSDLQFSDRALVPLEQFAIGGLYSVRGYRQDLLLTDNGFFMTAEVRLPILRVASIKGVLQIVPFVDFGIGWNDRNNSIPNPNQNILVSVGLGLQWQIDDDRLTASFDWGIPLTNASQSNNTLQEQGLYFSLNLKLF